MLGSADLQITAHVERGIVDLGTLRGALKTLRSQGSEESEAIERLGAKVERLYAKKLQALTVVTTSKRDYIGSFLNWVEGWIEFLDGARRMHQSRSLSRDLRDLRVSHAKAAIEMRELYDRTKGGWLAKKFRG